MSKPKCPFKFGRYQFEGGEECDPTCAWALDNACFIDHDAQFEYTCAIAVIAQQVNAEDINLYCASNKLRPGDGE